MLTCLQYIQIEPTANNHLEIQTPLEEEKSSNPSEARASATKNGFNKTKN